MKNNFFKALPIILCCAFALSGCGKSDGGQSSSTNVSTPVIESADGNSRGADNTSTQHESSDPESESASENTVSTAENTSENNQLNGGTLNVAFGDKSKPFTLYLYDNPTAAAVKKHVGTADWQLPIYHFDDYENWEVMQYYDVPSRYEIPNDPENITSEKAGEVYYSEPNRIILFYGDAEVSAEYTKVGYFDFTEEFRSAVENNPVLEGWGNKLVFIMPGD